MSTLRGLLLAFALLLLAPPATAVEAPPKSPAPATPATISGALMQGLDKTTARVSRFEAPLNQKVKFGTLELTVSTCRVHPPEEPPESAAFVTITETKPGDTEPQSLFKGWMFASSPALSALEHPVYDVWVLSCTTDTGSSDKHG